jgi:hypothetical protein
MDCNRVFMILTRGPFPTGESWDEEVEAHLEKCADCWQLAEALRPALEVFQEAIPPAESRDLPGYWGDARPAAAVVSEMNRSAARVAMMQGVRQLTRTYQQYHNDSLSPSTPAFVLRAVAIATAMAASAALSGLLWKVW